MKIECSDCLIEKPKRDITRIKDSWRCKDCQRKRFKEHREYLKRDILGIRKREDLMKEWQEKREQRQLIPKIKGQKDTSRTKKTNYFKGLWLTKLEKFIIYKKYASLGYDTEAIHKKYEEIKNVFEKMQEKMKEENKTNEEIGQHFKEQFAKLIMEENGK